MVALSPTQATIQKTFSDGRPVLELMVKLVRNPREIRQLPLMRVSRGHPDMLGRRSYSSLMLGQDASRLWFSADNRRCFMFKVIAPLCDLTSVRVMEVTWTSEFDCKLMQCPRQGDTWSTDAASIEAVRDELIKLLVNDSVPESSWRGNRQRAAASDEVFDPSFDYVSKLKVHLDATTSSLGRFAGSVPISIIRARFHHGSSHRWKQRLAQGAPAGTEEIGQAGSCIPGPERNSLVIVYRLPSIQGVQL